MILTRNFCFGKQISAAHYNAQALCVQLQYLAMQHFSNVGLQCVWCTQLQLPLIDECGHAVPF